VSETFARYVALGDSMSIDLFAALDVGATDVAVALERDPGAGHVAPLGAASLFHRNDDVRYADMAGADLSSVYPGIAFQPLASHGATIGDVFGEQLLLLGASHERTLITLTIGGEDLFSAFSAKPKPALLARIASDLTEAYDLLVDAIQRARPESLLLLTTVCDPSDRLGKVPGILDDVGKLPLSALDAFNAHIRSVAAGTPRVALADADAEFLGHGQSVDEADRWYWKRSPLELNARGAHELRRVWLTALDHASRRTAV
jgi:hypothetical protein